MGIASVRAQGPIILNVLRGLNVVALLTAAVASVCVILKTERDPVGYWFFDCLSHVFSVFMCLFLIVSEFPVLASVRRYFEVNWPLLSHHHGLSWLAVIMVILSSRLVGAPYNATRRLDGPFLKVVLAGGFFVFAMAVFNFILSLVFRDRGAAVNARTIRSRNASAAASVADSSSFRSSPSTRVAAPETKAGGRILSKFFGGKKEAASEFPRYNISGPINRPSTSGSRPYPESNYGAPDDRRSPLDPNIRRPDTAMHPMFNRTLSPNRYSESSMTRFGDDDPMVNKI